VLIVHGQQEPYKPHLIPGWLLRLQLIWGRLPVFIYAGGRRNVSPARSLLKYYLSAKHAPRIVHNEIVALPCHITVF
jgi:hypothetical protein